MANISEILRKLRKYELRIRKLVNTQNQGNFQSIFRGSGLEFDDIRQYQYGDDVRAINWNVTAKGHGTYIKTFKEEKEQTVFFVVDESASERIGTRNKTKRDVCREITGVLALSAVKESSRVGVVGFSDTREYYYPPSKGQLGAYRLINSMFKNTPVSNKTSLVKAFKFIHETLKKRSLLFIVSDFIDTGYERELIKLSRYHDLICIRVESAAEKNIVKLGIVPVKEVESGQVRWVNTNSSGFIRKHSRQLTENADKLKDLSRKYGFNLVDIQVEKEFEMELVKLFNTRKNKKNAS